MTATGPPLGGYRIGCEGVREPAPQPFKSPDVGSHAPSPASRTKASQTPAREGMVLTNEAGLRRKNPRWPLVERVIRELDPGHINSFASLSLPGNTYIQCLRGFNGWHLEWRISDLSFGESAYIHMRACYPGASKKPFELKKYDCMNQGEHRDLLNLEDVIDAFRSFHRAEGPPAWLEWRDLEI